MANSANAQQSSAAQQQSASSVTSSSSNTALVPASAAAVANNSHSQAIQNVIKNPFVSVNDVLSHKLTMFNYRLPNDRNMFESSLIYCNMCDYSCDLTDKSAIICHFVAKHPQDSIVYSYLWPQMEMVNQQFKIKYYLIKANLKIRNKENQAQSRASFEFPNTVLNSDEEKDEESITDQDELGDVNVRFVLNKMIDWVEKSVAEASSSAAANITTAASVAEGQNDVQELEEEQEVQEVEMTGEDLYEPGAVLTAAAQEQASLGDLLKLTSSALYYTNQQKLVISNAPSAPTSLALQLDNTSLVHLLAINKSENVFRVKQIHDYYGGCFICGKQVEFNMKHYQTHFNSEMTAYICLHCNYKEFKQDTKEVKGLSGAIQLAGSSGSAGGAGGSSGTQSVTSGSASSSNLSGNGSAGSGASSTSNNAAQCSGIGCSSISCTQCSSPCDIYQIDQEATSPEEKLLQAHMHEAHQINYQQILQQHLQLKNQKQVDDEEQEASATTTLMIESTPMHDMYITLHIKQLKYIDDDLLRRDEFHSDMLYSCPICIGDISVHNPQHVNPNLAGTSAATASATTTTTTTPNAQASSTSASPSSTNTSSNLYSQYENVTFDYLMSHFLQTHQFKAVPLYVCSLCNCVRVSLIDCVYHYVRHHFNKRIVVGMCAYNIYDRVQAQLGQLQSGGLASASAITQSTSTGSKKSSNHQQQLQHQLASLPLSQLQLPLSLTTANTIYGQAGPLIHCITCNENYTNEHAFIRHSYLAHLLDPNINLNWFKCYSTSNQLLQASGGSVELALQQIANAMQLADTQPSSGSEALDANGQPVSTEQQLSLHYECPVCFKSVQSKDSIQRHLLYHALNESYEYDLSCSGCTKALIPSQNLAECLLHTREFRSHRITVSFHKYALSSSGESATDVVNPQPVVTCVLCQSEHSNLISCIAHIMLDHFSYDSGTIRIKRVVNQLLYQQQQAESGDGETPASVSTTQSPKTVYQAFKIKQNKFKHQSSAQDQYTQSLAALTVAQCNPELVEYFSALFPSIYNELVLQASCLHNSNGNNGQQVTTKVITRPDSFLSDVKCFKCGKFSTKLVKSLFAHLASHHGYEWRELDKLYEFSVQNQLQVINEQRMIEKYEQKQKECAAYQQSLLKERSEKQQQLQILGLTDGQASDQQIAAAFMQLHQGDIGTGTTQAVLLTDQTAGDQLVLQQAQQPQQIVLQTNTTNPSHTNMHVPKQPKHQPAVTNNAPTSQMHPDRIDSTIDQVLSQICKDDFKHQPSNHHHHHHQQTQHHQQSQNMLVDQNQQIQQVIQQPPEAENLFVFKCNLCEPYVTDDATALLDHYKLQHQVELTIADSSTLLAAAVAAFQTGHTIEMTGAILNTLSTVTDENGVTIISGEEVPVHTTVQYKCTLCQTIFYEKQYIVQHLYGDHGIEIDIAYFEEIEQQQQEQLQQKIYEQQQEQMMLQQQQSGQLDDAKMSIDQAVTASATQVAPSSNSTSIAQAIPLSDGNSTGAAASSSLTAQILNSIPADDTAAVMVMLTNGTQVLLPASQVQQLIANGGATVTTTSQPGQDGIQAAQLIVNAQGLAQLEAQHGQNLLTAQPIIATPLPMANVTPVQQSVSQSSIGSVASNTNITSAVNKVNYSCTYCSFGAEKIKKMSDHLRSTHPNRDKTCMDNLRQQLIRLPNDDNIGTTSQPPATVGAILSMQQQYKQQQQQMAPQPQMVSSVMTVDPTKQYLQTSTNLQSVSAAQQSAASAAGKKRGPKPKNTIAGGYTGRANTVANTLSRQQQLQQQQTQPSQQQTQAQSFTHIKNPTILTMDANSQIIIDFNQNDDLACAYCEYVMNNLNYMRTHIKFKHKNMAITFQNKQSQRYYTIVEWPLTPVPTLTPAAAASSASTTTPNGTQTSTTQVSAATTASNLSSNTPGTNTSGIAASGAVITAETPLKGTENVKSDEHNVSGTPLTTTTTSTPKSASNRSHKKEPAFSSKVSDGSLSINTTSVNSILKKLGVNVTASASSTQGVGSSTSTSNVTNTTGTSAAGVSTEATSGTGTTTGASTSTVLSALSSSLAGGSNMSGKNNSVVNVNINFLKDVNIDEMIDDDDDEERKFLIRELEKRSSSKRGGKSESGSHTANSNGYNSDSGSATGESTITPVGSGRGVKRSRSNSSSQKLNTSSGALTPSAQENKSASNQQLLSQMNITLNCHYCWAQFQLNVSKNMKLNLAAGNSSSSLSISQQQQLQQKENGKYMQHLALHLNAPYKCNECSYPITDTKTFFKHRQFYKHDEKTCIMVDNDVTLNQQQLNAVAQAASSGSGNKRKALISTRLKQQILEKEKDHKGSSSTGNDSGSDEPEHDKDTFKCNLCHGGDDANNGLIIPLPSQPTVSSQGASSYSFDKEQVLKHVLIVHLSFLAYKCDSCTQFYAFDEPQTKQHAALVHIGDGSGSSTPACQFKLIKTDEEINLAISRAQQFIAKIPAVTSSSSTSTTSRRETSSRASKQLSNLSLANITLEAQPKYRCCKCIQASASPNVEENPAGGEASKPADEANKEPIVLYTYQDALDHVLCEHLTPNAAASSPTTDSSKKENSAAANKKISFELELFEQNLEDLIQSETGVVSTISHAEYVKRQQLKIKNEDDVDNNDEDVENNGEVCDESEHYYPNSDLSEWHFILSEPTSSAAVLATSSSSTTAAAANNNSSQGVAQRRTKRFRSNSTQPAPASEATTTTTVATISPASDTFYDPKKLKKFLYKPYLIYKCQICSRKMNSFNIEHWLQHDRENHFALLNKESDKQFVYQQITVNPASVDTPADSTETQQGAESSTSASVTTAQLTTYPSFTQFIEKFKQQTHQGDENRLINCLVCGHELHFTHADISKHYQSQHEINIFDENLSLSLADLDLLQQLTGAGATHQTPGTSSNQIIQVWRGVHIRRRCYIPSPISSSSLALTTTHRRSSTSSPTQARVELIDKELRMLNLIYREQIVEKQIVSWLNSEQFFRRTYNYNSHVCIVCNATRLSILNSHYQLSSQQQAAKTPKSASTNVVDSAAVANNRLQYFSDEMRTVVLTNHILGHFNEYCYRCMSCKISWPDRNQLMRHTQECANSQLVRTKTKYKLKANCRMQLKFNIQSYMEYWLHERYLESRKLSDQPSTEIRSLGTTFDMLTAAEVLEADDNVKVYLKDVFKSKQLLLDLATKHGLTSIQHNDGDKSIKIGLEDETTGPVITTEATSQSSNSVSERARNEEVEDDVEMKDIEEDK